MFGGPFLIPPRFTAGDPEEFDAAFERSDTATDDAGQAPPAWLTRLARVRPTLAALETVAMYGPALGTESPLALQAGQLPLASAATTNGGPTSWATGRRFPSVAWPCWWTPWPRRWSWPGCGGSTRPSYSRPARRVATAGPGRPAAVAPRAVRRPLGRLPGERSYVSLVWAVLDQVSRGWRGVMTPAGVRLLQDLSRQLLGPPQVE